MGRCLGPVALGLSLALVGACGGDVAVHRYPDAEEARERGSSGGEPEPVQRSRMPTPTGGPHPQDELAGESTEPL